MLKEEKINMWMLKDKDKHVDARRGEDKTCGCLKRRR